MKIPGLRKAVERLEKRLEKHLQGRHNQLSHGRGGGGSARRSGRGRSSKPGKEEPKNSYTRIKDIPDDFEKALEGIKTEEDASLVAMKHRLPEIKASRYRDDGKKLEALRMGLRGAKQCKDAIEGDPLYADADLVPNKVTVMNVDQVGGGDYNHYAGEYHWRGDTAEIAASGRVMRLNSHSESMSLIPGEHNVDISVEGTVRHEIGHHVHYDLDNRYGRASKRAAWKEFEQWADEKIASKNMNDPDSPARLSLYAMANSHEAFAEAFCMYTHPRFDRTNQGKNGSPKMPPTAHRILQNLMKGERRTFSLAD